MTSDVSLAINFDTTQFQLSLGSKPLVQGVSDLMGQWKDKILAPLQLRVTQTCEHHKNGCDYFEFDWPLTQHYRLQRGFLLDHTHRLMVLGDTLRWDGKRTPTKAGLLTYESRLVFAPNISLARESKQLDVEILNNSARTLGRILPLCLPALEGKLKIDGRRAEYGIKYSLQGEGPSLFAPLVFDLDAARCKQPATWRQLTVGEEMQKVDAGRAVGFRVQLGKEQFLLYRSMTPMANRSVLGHNLIDDFCYATFSPEAGVSPLVEVRQEEMTSRNLEKFL